MTILLLAAAAWATDICGPIVADTTWTAAGGPYHITCDTTVLTNTTLTLMPGTEVRVDPNVSLHVAGYLDVDGTPANPVFIGQYTAGSRWGGIQLRTNQGGHADIDHATIDGAWSGVNVECCWGYPEPANLRNVVLTHHSSALPGYAGYNVIVEDSEIAFNDYGTSSADKYLLRTWLHDNVYGAHGERTTIVDSVIEDNQYGASIRGSVSYSVVSNNDVGLHLWPGTATYNDVQGNDVGIDLADGSTATLNNLDLNTIAVRVANASNATAPSNWWGTTDPLAIASLVWDIYDDSWRGWLDVSVPANNPILTTYAPPEITDIDWRWSTSQPLGTDLRCEATDNGTITSYNFTVSNGNQTWTGWSPTETWTFVAPARGVYRVSCSATDDEGLTDRSSTVTFWIAEDSDFDGVIDDWDVCPATPAGDPVDPDGCSMTCDAATWTTFNNTVEIPAVYLPNGSCRSVRLDYDPGSATWSIGATAACRDACVPAVFLNPGRRLILPTVEYDGVPSVAVFERLPTGAFQLVFTYPQ